MAGAPTGGVAARLERREQRNGPAITGGSGNSGNRGTGGTLGTGGLGTGGGSGASRAAGAGGMIPCILDTAPLPVHPRVRRENEDRNRDHPDNGSTFRHDRDDRRRAGSGEPTPLISCRPCRRSKHGALQGPADAADGARARSSEHRPHSAHFLAFSCAWRIRPGRCVQRCLFPTALSGTGDDARSRVAF
jgi:hypothetical protein